MIPVQPAALQKITARHLQRQAMLYVRQSTLHQVLENTESTARQYALRERAIALGWPAEQIVVIDQDLGHSGASAADREGFQRLVAEVGLGHVGLVMGLEVSRLARSSLDWHHLLEICAMTGTLILDEDGLYDPATFNDRLLLGLKGTMSEAELHVLRARLRGGILNKAQRAALRLPLPMGLAYAEDETVILDPDAQIQQAIGMLFATFKRTGSATATVKYFRTKALLFPRRVHTGPHAGEVHWGPLLHSTMLKVLRNPRYAGAFCACRARARRNSLTVRIIPRPFPRITGSFSSVALTLDISPGRNMKRICSSCSRIVRRTEKIADMVLRGKGPHCSRGSSSVGAVAIG
jgi:DNA invertase Pin-like site-specific DNA recombinase